MKNKILITLLIISVFFVGGCSAGGVNLNVKSKNTVNMTNNGGVYLSINQGQTWSHVVGVPKLSGNESIGFMNVNKLSVDPNDVDAVYLASKDYGMYYTYNVLQGWTKADSLGSKNILDVQVDPDNKCKIYVSFDNKVYRSMDCSRSFQQVYLDPDVNAKVNTIAIDDYNTNNIYIGTSNNDMFKSIDNGRSWKRIKIFENPIEHIMINPEDSRDIFVATRGNNLYRMNSTAIPSFEELERFPNRLNIDDLPNLKENFEGIEIGDKFVDLQFSEKSSVITWATNKFILRSNDGGLSWKQVDLLTTADKSDIRTMAVNPHNAKEIYYGTANVFVRSLDGGVSWTVLKMPTARLGSDILIDRNNTNIIYLAVMENPDVEK